MFSKRESLSKALFEITSNRKFTAMEICSIIGNLYPHTYPSINQFYGYNKTCMHTGLKIQRDGVTEIPSG